MNNLSFFFIVLLTLSIFSCSSNVQRGNVSQQDTPQDTSKVLESAEIVIGAARFEEYLDELKGKKVGLVVNQTSAIDGVHLVDTLLSLGVNVTKIFAPEHGFR